MRTTNTAERVLIDQIAERASLLSAKYGFSYPVGDARMDIICAHRDIGLQLQQLFLADDFNFAHDVFGINRNLDHETFLLQNNFRPRFSIKA